MCGFREKKMYKPIDPSSDPIQCSGVRADDLHSRLMDGDASSKIGTFWRERYALSLLA